LNDLGVPDVISVPRVRGGYPAEKPWEVADVLINQSSVPGEIVADPFMGSGSVGVAALKLSRRFLGNDLNPEAVQIAGQRLAAVGGSGVGPAEAGPYTDLLSLLPERR
jgi:site-specific DNA-methyltransferase (adenine-specific)